MMSMKDEGSPAKPMKQKRVAAKRIVNTKKSATRSAAAEDTKKADILKSEEEGCEEVLNSSRGDEEEITTTTITKKSTTTKRRRITKVDKQEKEEIKEVVKEDPNQETFKMPPTTARRRRVARRKRAPVKKMREEEEETTENDTDTDSEDEAMDVDTGDAVNKDMEDVEADEVKDELDEITSADKDKENTYECERTERIRKNKEFLRSLGLAKLNSPQKPATTKKKATSSSKEEVVTPVAQRKSRRLQGAPPEEFKLEDTVASSSPEDYRIGKRTELPFERISNPNCRRYLYVPVGRRQSVVEEELYAPLGLCSIGTTVLSLGTVKFHDSRYWSSAQCAYKHPYPIGYHAQKHHFGRLWNMEIRERKQQNENDSDDDSCDNGPLFVVYEEGKRGVKEYTGKTPTFPWTEVCKASYSPGTRISGPLFFGFSDPIVQKLIRDLVATQTTTAAAQNSSQSPEQ